MINVLWLKIFKIVYWKDLVVSFVVIMGVVDVVIGGVELSWFLFFLGMGIVGVVIILCFYLFKGFYIE